MTAENQAKAVCLLSGGLDSTTTLAIAASRGFDCYCLSFAYGQRQDIELRKAAEIAAGARASQHLVLHLDLDKIGGSALTGDLAVPKNREFTEMESSIPSTYVPARNIIFLSHAVAWAEVLGAGDIFLGINAVDYSGYPDCRPEFLAAYEKAVNLGTKAGNEGGRPFTFHAPLIHMTKKEIIEKGLALGVDYSLTHTCYDPDKNGVACGVCDACRLRRKGFAEAGIVDPIRYQQN